MVPKFYRRFEHENQIQKTWEDAIDNEMQDSPQFVETTLRNAKKRKVVFFKDFGTKWD